MEGRRRGRYIRGREANLIGSIPISGKRCTSASAKLLP